MFILVTIESLKKYNYIIYISSSVNASAQVSIKSFQSLSNQDQNQHLIAIQYQL